MEEYGIGLDVIVRTDGEKAMLFIDDIEAGHVPCPSLVVLDLNLPKRTGLEVLNRIRESRSCGNVPVVVFSSSDAAKDRNAAASLGANRYVRKPSDFDSFLRVGSVLKELLETAQ